MKIWVSHILTENYVIFGINFSLRLELEKILAEFAHQGHDSVLT